MQSNKDDLLLIFIIFMSVVVPTAITWLVIYCEEFKAWIEHKNNKDKKKGVNNVKINKSKNYDYHHDDK